MDGEKQRGRVEIVDMWRPVARLQPVHFSIDQTPAPMSRIEVILRMAALVMLCPCHLARIFHTPMVHRALRLRKRTAMRAGEAKPRRARESGKCSTLFPWQNAFRTDTRLLVPFPGAVLPTNPVTVLREACEIAGLVAGVMGSLVLLLAIGSGLGQPVLAAAVQEDSHQRDGVKAAASSPSDATRAASSAETLHVVETIRRRYALPALAVVVVKDGRILDRAAAGVRKVGDSTPVTTNDLFHIGSCTKAMTATLAALLIEEGTLRWDTTIAEVLPELKGSMDRQYEPVTVEQLLTHRGGCPNQPPPDAWRRAWKQKGAPAEQRREFIGAVLAQPPEAAPGMKMIYSNQGYSVIGAMLERLAGESWETLITRRLFKPLGMSSAGFGPPGTLGKVDQPWGHKRKDSVARGLERARPRSAGHESREGIGAGHEAGDWDRFEARLAEARPDQIDNPPAIGPGGRVHCTLEDLARFTIMHLDGERGGGLLRPETFRRLHSPPPGFDYACGWRNVRRDWAQGQALTHDGSNTAWYVVMWLAPEIRFSVVVGTNMGGSDASKGCDEVAGAMIGKWLAQPRQEE